MPARVVSGSVAEILSTPSTKTFCVPARISSLTVNGPNPPTEKSAPNCVLVPPTVLNNLITGPSSISSAE